MGCSAAVLSSSPWVAPEVATKAAGRAAGWVPGAAMAAGAAAGACTALGPGRGWAGESPVWSCSLVAAGTAAGDFRGSDVAVGVLVPSAPSGLEVKLLSAAAVVEPAAGQQHVVPPSQVRSGAGGANRDTHSSG